ncbi:hypothetical protein Tco_0452417, partial [Tanacetum coccineum]
MDGGLGLSDFQVGRVNRAGVRWKMVMGEAWGSGTWDSGLETRKPWEERFGFGGMGGSGQFGLHSLHRLLIGLSRPSDGLSLASNVFFSSGSGFDADYLELTLTLAFLDFGLDFAQSFPFHAQFGHFGL